MCPFPLHDALPIYGSVVEIAVAELQYPPVEQPEELAVDSDYVLIVDVAGGKWCGGFVAAEAKKELGVGHEFDDGNVHSNSWTADAVVVLLAATVEQLSADVAADLHHGRGKVSIEAEGWAEEFSCNVCGGDTGWRAGGQAGLGSVEVGAGEERIDARLGRDGLCGECCCKGPNADARELHGRFPDRTS